MATTGHMAEHYTLGIKARIIEDRDLLLTIPALYEHAHSTYLDFTISTDGPTNNADSIFLCSGNADGSELCLYVVQKQYGV